VRKILAPIAAELSTVGSVHEMYGLSLYRLGRWADAAAELELHRQLTGSVDHLPVIADCYRALHRYKKVDELWLELREVSPSAALVAEGRIVAAGAKADQDDLRGALAIMSPADTHPAKIREHHLRLWYVLADLYDRSGDVVKARALFERIREHDSDFADVDERLLSLGS
jgi:tetratricopeptide (TPR) repeat protein